MDDRWLERIMEEDDTLSDRDKVILKYGAVKLLHLLWDTLFTMILGGILHIIVESIIFQFFFILLRTYAGGCHSKTELQCKIHSAFVTIVSLFFIRWMPDAKLSIWICSAAFSAVIIFLAPVEAPNKPLSDGERKVNRRKALFITIEGFTGVSLGMAANLRILYKPLAVVIGMVSILMIIGAVDKAVKEYRT